MNDVAVFVGPGDFFVAQLDLLKGGYASRRKHPDVVHFRCDFHQLDVFQFGVEIFNFLTGVVDFVPLELSRLQGLTGGHRFVQIRAGRVDFFGKQERRVYTGSGQFASVSYPSGYTGCVPEQQLRCFLRDLSHQRNL